MLGGVSEVRDKSGVRRRPDAIRRRRSDRDDATEADSALGGAERLRPPA
jgi:hypothetical protein